MLQVLKNDLMRSQKKKKEPGRVLESQLRTYAKYTPIGARKKKKEREKKRWLVYLGQKKEMLLFLTPAINAPKA